MIGTREIRHDTNLFLHQVSIPAAAARFHREMPGSPQDHGVCQHLEVYDPNKNMVIQHHQANSFLSHEHSRQFFRNFSPASLVCHAIVGIILNSPGTNHPVSRHHLSP